MNILVSIIFFVSLILAVYPFGNDKRIENCKICLYDKCPSRYLTSFCSKIQFDNEDLYLHFIQNNTDGLNELTKLHVYSTLYGFNMDTCIRMNRQICKEKFCDSKCFDGKFAKSEVSQIEQDRVKHNTEAFEIGSTTFNTDRENDIFKEYIFNSELTPAERDSIFDSIPIQQYYRLANRDNCFLNSANFRKLYTECHISLFRDTCIEDYTEEIKSRC